MLTFHLYNIHCIVYTVLKRRSPCLARRGPYQSRFCLTSMVPCTHCVTQSRHYISLVAQHGIDCSNPERRRRRVRETESVKSYETYHISSSGHALAMASKPGLEPRTQSSLILSSGMPHSLIMPTHVWQRFKRSERVSYSQSAPLTIAVPPVATSGSRMYTRSTVGSEGSCSQSVSSGTGDFASGALNALCCSTRRVVGTPFHETDRCATR